MKKQSELSAITAINDLVSIRTIDRIGVISVENPPVNAMSVGVPGGILKAVKVLENTCDGLVLIAGGKGIWGGADIKMQGRPWPESEPKLVDLIRGLEHACIPIAMVLQSAALGGGLEIAMACRFRVAVAGTKLGQPEVKLGIPPGAGGTQRLPRLVGVKHAIDMILSGTPINADRALNLGLVDQVIADANDPLDAAVQFLMLKIAGDELPPRTCEREIGDFDSVIFETERQRIDKKNKGELAPLVCLRCIEVATEVGFEEGLQFERDQFNACVQSDQALALRHVFFAERIASKLPVIDEPIIPIKQVAIIGAGTMGTGIAMCFANALIPVVLVDRDRPSVEKGMQRINDFYQSSLSRKRLTEQQVGARLACIQGSHDLSEIAEVDLVIEAVFEEIHVKRSVLEEVDKVVSRDAIIATNTSYLDINEMASFLPDRRQKIVGLHFFSPANIMRLLEIVRTDHSSDQVIASALTLSKRLAKQGIVARVCHGFIANRMYSTYLREAEFLLQEGASPRQVDAVLTKFGMPMGPFAVRDLAGLDIGWAMRKATAHKRSPSQRYSTIGDEICERGWFGQKTSKGFYCYESGSRVPLDNPEVDSIITNTALNAGIKQRDLSEQEILERCLFAVVNEGADLLQEGIAQRSSDIDLAWIFGYGFPRWRGGPMFWATQLGLSSVVEKIQQFDRSNDFWQPSALLLDAVANHCSLDDVSIKGEE